ncbi:MAG: hypothetical protein ACFCGT_17645 [Sandaracinaceae bacterium]
MRWTMVMAGALALVACGGDEAASSGALQLGQGFSPDPRVMTGTAGGGTDATAWGGDCAGMVPSQPQHTLEVTHAFPGLKIAAIPTGDSEDADLTIAVRTPDGTYWCNDDYDGLDPMVGQAYPAGTYGIFVGLLGEGTAAYKLGISELVPFEPSTLREE